MGVERRVTIDLEGRVALVTGGSRGIGRACSATLARAGAKVAVGYHAREEEAASIIEEIAREGGEARSFKADLSDESQVRAMLARVHGQMGDVAILVNNAGIWEGSPITRLSAGDWDRTFTVNMRSMFLVTRGVVPMMARIGSGCIVNIASTAGQRGEAHHADYAASKGAAISFTRSLAVELAPQGIRVNCVAPGWVDTEMSAPALVQGGREAIARTIPMGRVGRPEEIAGAVLFAVSDLSSFMTGAVVSVNGGAVMA